MRRIKEGRRFVVVKPETGAGAAAESREGKRRSEQKEEQ